MELPARMRRGEMLLVAGPCSAESRGQVLRTAEALSDIGVGVLRAGLWKPRTHPDTFQGVGVEGLSWLTEARRKTGMLIATEVATPDHLLAALDARVDVVWLGARTVANPFAVQALADILAAREGELPTVLVKNPISPDVELWIGALQRLWNAGVRRLAAVHRGFVSGHSAPLRNAPQWEVAIALRRECPELPMLCDPSHIAGDCAMVADIAQEALDMGFDGLMIESHIAPEHALSDASQQLTPEQLGTLLSGLRPRRKGDASEELNLLRRQVDDCDRELLETLARRMEVVERIGRIKRRDGIAVVQPDRFKQVLARQLELAAALGLDADFVARVYALVHDQAAKRQLGDEQNDL